MRILLHQSIQQLRVKGSAQRQSAHRCAKHAVKLYKMVDSSRFACALSTRMSIISFRCQQRPAQCLSQMRFQRQSVVRTQRASDSDLWSLSPEKAVTSTLKSVRHLQVNGVACRSVLWILWLIFQCWTSISLSAPSLQHHQLTLAVQNFIRKASRQLAAAVGTGKSRSCVHHLISPYEVVI